MITVLKKKTQWDIILEENSNGGMRNKCSNQIEGFFQRIQFIDQMTGSTPGMTL